MKAGVDGFAQRAPGKGIPDLEQPRDADALVVRESSLPVTERPASFQPTLIQGPSPSVKTVGCSGTRHSIATIALSSSA